MGVVPYGVVGGVRSAELLRLMAGEPQMADVRINVVVSSFADFQNFTEFEPGEHHGRALDTLIGEVLAWSEVLAP